VLNHVDYVDYSCRSDNLPSRLALDFVEKVEGSIEAPVTYLGFDPYSLMACRHAPKIARVG
jgi:hypothetical protein